MNPMISPPIFPISDSCWVYLPEGPWFLRIRDATWPTSCWTNPESQRAAAWYYGSPGRKARGANDAKRRETTRTERPLGKWGGSWSNQRKMREFKYWSVSKIQNHRESGDFKILASRPGGLSGKDGEAEENGEENIKNTAISPTNKCRIRIAVNLTKPRFDRFFSISRCSSHLFNAQQVSSMPVAVCWTLCGSAAKLDGATASWDWARRGKLSWNGYTVRYTVYMLDKMLYRHM